MNSVNLQSLFQQRQYKQCIEHISANTHSPKQLSTWLIEGLSHAALQNRDKAVEVLLSALEKFPRHPELIVHVAQLYIQSEKFQKALEILNEVKLRHHQISLLQAKALNGLNRCEEALETLDDSKKQGLDLLSYHLQTTQIYRNLARPDLAQVEIEQALKIKGNDFHLLYQKACLLREQGKQTSAIEVFREIYPLGKNLPELNFVIGCTYYDLGDYDRTEEYLEICLSLAPYYIPAHECLGKLRWQQSRKEEFLKSYNLTRQSHPVHPLLERSRIAQLLVAGQYEEALESANWARRQMPSDIHFTHLAGVAYSRLGDDNRSVPLLHQAAVAEPNNPRFQVDYANHEIYQADYKSAQERLEPLLNFFSDNQELWAYLGICWRLSGDERHFWLNDYQRYVRSYDLPVSSSYDNFEHFIDTLKNTVMKFHKTDQEQPLDQSVQGGSQSEGHLLFQNTPVIKAYRESLEQVINQYLKGLPNDPRHPLCRRNTGKFKIAGSWSVNLAKNGFHTNHIHSQGWLSGPTYLSIPKTIHSDDPTRQGWVKFGETSIGLGSREEVALAICPKPGQIVLFPSYMWHGTYPFNSEEQRMTLPCDISPLC